MGLKHLPSSALVLWRFRYHLLCALVVAGAWDTLWMKPFRVLVVMVHEACHAGAALVTGGRVVQLRAHWDESGMALTRGGWFPLISSAGYVGSALLGAALIAAGRWPLLQRLATAVLGCGVAVLVLLYTPVAGVDFFLGLGGGIALAVLALHSRRLGSAVSVWLGVLLCLYSLHDFRSDLWYRPRATDAGILARYWGWDALAYPIAGVWVALSVAAMYWSLRSLGRHAGGSRRTERPVPSEPVG